jgi:succinyl-diaminopimelate desuccinylase
MNYDNIEVIQLTRELIRIDSTNVGAFEGEISDFVEKWLRKNTQAEIWRDEFLPGRANVIAKLKGETAEPNLVYIAHMDTVPVGNGWTQDPFRGDIIGGRLYGRGTHDMKAGLAAMMIAFRETEKFYRESGRIPRHDFLFIASGDEEGVMLGADRVVDAGLVTNKSLVLDAESTDCQAMMAHKGKTWFEFTMLGKAAHSSIPYTGVDAVAAMAEVVSEVRKRMAMYPLHPVMGPSTATFGMIRGGDNINIVPDKCTLLLDMRLSPGVSTEESLKIVDDAIHTACARIEGATGSYDAFAKRPYVEDNMDSLLLKKLRESSLRALGKDVEVGFFPGYTDSGVIDGRLGCGNCMSYGPVGKGRHQTDEYVECDSVIDVLAVITDLAKNILG